MRLIILILGAMLLIGTASASNAEITSFSNNYTSDSDIMFNCTQTTIQFNISVADTANITWYNDKVILTTDNGSLTHNYTISDIDIHEIRVETDNGTSTDSIEWIVTNKSLADAPDFFEFFADSKYNSRSDTDPWGRTLIEWTSSSGTTPTFTKQYLVPSADFRLSNQSANAYGTWKYKYYMPNADDYDTSAYKYSVIFISSDAVGAYPEIRLKEDPGSHSWLTHKDSEGSHHMAYTHGLGEVSFGQMQSRGNADWIEIWIVRTTNDMWYVFRQMPYTVPYIPEQGNTMRLVGGMPDKWDRLTDASGKYIVIENDGFLSSNPFYFDSFEFYYNETIWPNEVKYATYTTSAPDSTFENSSITKIPNLGSAAVIPYDFTTMNGIVVDGRNVTLQDIETLVNDQTKFSYDVGTKTGVIKTNLSLLPSSSLYLTDETLIFYDISNNLKVRMLRGSELHLSNSTITSNTSNPWFMDFYTRRWTSDVHGESCIFPCNQDVSDASAIHYTGSHNFLYLNDSIINNSYGWEIASPTEVCFNNTQFTNLTSTAGYLWWMTNNLVQVSDIFINNITITAKTGTGIIAFKGGDSFVETQVLNSDFGDNQLQISDMYADGIDIGRVQHMVNTNASNISLYSDKAILHIKQYLDVEVVDTNGNPISGANVIVINEINPNIESQNLSTGILAGNTDTDFGFTVQASEIDRPTISGFDGNFNNQTLFTTGTDGHTPLPIGNESTTAVLINTTYDNWDGSIATTNYTYRINVTATGYSANNTTTGVSPDSTWYRTSANTYENTITIILSGGDEFDGNNVYVSPTGNDSNNGTLTNPFANISHADSVVYEGGTVWLINGEYVNETISITNNSVSFKAYNGTPTLNYCFVRNDGAASDNVSFTINKNFVTIDGLTIKNYDISVDIQTALNTTVSNCTIYAGDGVSTTIPTAGIRLKYKVPSATNASIQDNVIYLNKTVYGIFVMGGNQNYSIHDNNITSIGSYAPEKAIALDAGYRANKYGEIYDNEFSSNHVAIYSTGSATYECSNHEIHDNLYTMVNQNCIELKDHTNNNTIYDENGSISGTASGMVVYNNADGNRFTNITLSISGGTTTFRVYNSNDTVIEDSILTTTTNSPVVQIEQFAQNNTVKDSTLNYSVGGGIGIYLLQTNSSSANYIDNLTFIGGGTDIKVNNATNDIVTDTELSKVNMENTWSKLNVTHTNNLVFETDVALYPYYNASFSSIDISGVTGLIKFTQYNMTAIPTTVNMTLNVTTFNTSLSGESILINFTADTDNSNNVTFLAWGLDINTDFFVKKDGVLLSERTSNSTGYLEFNNSVWTEHYFTVNRDIFTPTPNKIYYSTITPIANIVRTDSNITWGNTPVSGDVIYDGQVVVT